MNPREKSLFKAYGANPLSRREYLDYAKKVLGERFIEDAHFDMTVLAVIRNDTRSVAVIKAKECGILAGLEEIKTFYSMHRVKTKSLKKDGESVRKSEVIAEISGKESDLLKVERTGLNLLQRMSGIATAVNKLAEIAKPFKVKIVGTRKTLWNALDKRAIALGGGLPHRYGLYDSILIKDNHLSAIAREKGRDLRFEVAIGRAVSWKGHRRPGFIEVEVSGKSQAIAAAKEVRKWSLTPETRSKAWTGVPFIIMLDNMTPVEIKATVADLKKLGLFNHILLEASGGITERNLKYYASSGVDAISIGAITHSVIALDISQKIVDRKE